MAEAGSKKSPSEKATGEFPTRFLIARDKSIAMKPGMQIHVGQTPQSTYESSHQGLESRGLEHGAGVIWYNL